MSSASSYGAGARLLHHLALGSRYLGEVSLDIELSVYGKRTADSRHGKHVFVAGLARAGTTLLMRMMYGTGKFASLTYRDMPFVMAPNLWAKSGSRTSREGKSEERAHGDGVMVDFDSPEALEEVFWRVFCEPQYLKSACMIPMQADSETIDRFRQYVSLINFRYQHDRYLSKNNNNLLRLSSINQAFPSAVVLVPFRNPIQHAYSLLTQHRLFSQQQQDEPFTRNYMRWLGHHEFGLEHRPFLFDGNQALSELSTDSLDYWLQLWINVYTWLLNQYQGDTVNCVFVGYEILCNNPDETGSRLGELLELDSSFTKNQSLRPSSPEIPDSVSSQLRNRAEEIYMELTTVCDSMLLRK